MPTDIEVKYLPSAENAHLQGAAPIIVLGPNGAGKTRYAVQMSGWNAADMIGALRDIALPPDVVMRSMAQAQQELTNHLNRRRSHPWQLSSEINELFSKLMVEDSSSAIRFRDEHAKDNKTSPETTKLMRLQDVWARLFPGRQIDFSGYKPMVRSDYSTATNGYPAQQMSDGERVALYLAGRVLDSDKNIIIVDEPEVHFHSRLATLFWTEMEAIRRDCRFVYVTHDLPFALSRKNATFLVVMPNALPQIVSLASDLPKEVSESLLAAASFSIHARRIVFCEGTEGRSLDQRLYSSWFSGPETAVIPVGSCENVIRCATVFGNTNLVVGVQALGVVDRDYWPVEFLAAVPQPIETLRVHEVENLFCVSGVFVAIAEHLGKSKPTDLYDAFLWQARSTFSGGRLNKQISERFRRRCEHQLKKSLNALSLSDSLEEMRKSHAEGVESNKWGVQPSTILTEESERLQSAMAAGAEEFLMYFPGKAFLNLAADVLGIDTETYVGLVCDSLRADKADPLHAIRNKIEQALETHLPRRSPDS